ncbi:hypothetical protein E4T43_02310 [Aureobasidium subglaciale]|nr:hypothetical protein E4T43_02310 [Aureobasidium subglaciale]
MSDLPRVQPMPQVAAGSSMSNLNADPNLPAPSAFATPSGRPEDSQRPTDPSIAFNDPFTGVPSAPTDVSRLFLLCQCSPKDCTYSIPGSLFFLYFYAAPWREESRKFRKQIPPGARRYALDCERRSRIPTYTRLYTEWLFSGGAPSSLAKLHCNADGSTSVSFSKRVRACLYTIRLYQRRGYTIQRYYPQVVKIFEQQDEANLEVDQESWLNVILRTEPAEIPNDVWVHAYPTPTTQRSGPSQRQPASSGPRASDTTIQTEPFRGLASLRFRDPDDVPQGWSLWTPITVPGNQKIARELAYEQQRRQSLEHIDSRAAAPTRKINACMQAKSKHVSGQHSRLPSPDALAGAEEEDGTIEEDAEGVGIAQDPRRRLVQGLSHARRTNDTPDPLDTTTKRGRGRPRKSGTPAPAAAIKPATIRLRGPCRPSTPEQAAASEEATGVRSFPTPEQAAAFEEAMRNHSPSDRYVRDLVDTGNTYHRVNESNHRSLRSDVTDQIMDTLAQRAREELKDAGKSVDGVGSFFAACESTGFNPKDWE